MKRKDRVGCGFKRFTLKIYGRGRESLGSREIEDEREGTEIIKIQVWNLCCVDLFSKSLREREKRKINAQGIVKRKNSTDIPTTLTWVSKQTGRNGERDRKEENIRLR